MAQEAQMTKQTHYVPDHTDATAFDGMADQSPASPPKRRRGKTADTRNTLESAPVPKPASISKREQLIRMLSTKAGTDLATLGATLGWLPHTTRAALSGLRKAGHPVLTEKSEGGKPTRYRIAPVPSSASDAGSAPTPAPATTAGEA
jgi:Protein of unknown function (DUF3489)